MASSSPQRHFHFAESTQKIRMELRQADLKLKKEIQRMEREAHSTRNNISNHQQVLKNSWRRLEQKRLQDQLSPMTDRRMKRNMQSDHDSRKRLMFANKTALSHEYSGGSEGVNSNGSPPDNNRPSTHASHLRYKDDFSSTGSLPFLHGDIGDARQKEDHNGLPPLTNNPVVGSQAGYSPYLSSPYAFRRYRDTQPHSSNSVRRTSHPLTHQTAMTPQNVQVKGGPQDGNNTSAESKLVTASLDPTDTHLPPLDSSINSRSGMLNVSVKTVDKNTLLKARKLMEIDGDSHGPKSFEQFYNNHSSSPSSSKVMLTLEDLEDMTESDLMEHLTEDEQQKVQMAKKENSEMTLAEMFEQIKQCRYIRRYHPFGEHSDDEDVEQA